MNDGSPASRFCAAQAPVIGADGFYVADKLLA
jgi:hypothetical protein